MTAPALTPYRSAVPAGHDGFAQLLWAEWTKFRTVRGWVIGMIVAGLLTVGVGLLSHGECGSQAGPSGPVVTGGPGCASPLGPGGEAVTDGFYFLHQPLAGDGSITVRVTSMTGSYSPEGVSAQDLKQGLQPWSKAGIIIKANTSPGSAYAAMMVTGGHGVRMQWNYTGDAAGLSGAVSAASPRWLRLARNGDAITGYDSSDGAHWSVVGTATLTGLPATVPAGLFAASPDYAVVTSQSLGTGAGPAAPARPPPPSTTSRCRAPGRPAARGRARPSADPRAVLILCWDTASLATDWWFPGRAISLRCRLPARARWPIPWSARSPG